MRWRFKVERPARAPRYVIRASPFPVLIGIHSCLLVFRYDIQRERDRGAVSQLDGNQGRLIAGKGSVGEERSHYHRLRRGMLDSCRIARVEVDALRGRDRVDILGALSLLFAVMPREP